MVPVLPPLNGSPKQIAWADEIRLGVLAQIEAEGPGYPALNAGFRHHDDAGWWIDHRHRVLDFFVEELRPRPAPFGEIPPTASVHERDGEMNSYWQVTRVGMKTECRRRRYVVDDVAVEVQESTMTNGWLARLEPTRTVRVIRGDVELGWRRVPRGGDQKDVESLVAEIVAEHAEGTSAQAIPDAS